VPLSVGEQVLSFVSLENVAATASHDIRHAAPSL
jgi:hypothetical protein